LKARCENLAAKQSHREREREREREKREPIFICVEKIFAQKTKLLAIWPGTLIHFR